MMLERERSILKNFGCIVMSAVIGCSFAYLNCEKKSVASLPTRTSSEKGAARKSPAKKTEPLPKGKRTSGDKKSEQKDRTIKRKRSESVYPKDYNYFQQSKTVKPGSET